MDSFQNQGKTATVFARINTLLEKKVKFPQKVFKLDDCRHQACSNDCLF